MDTKLCHSEDLAVDRKTILEWIFRQLNMLDLELFAFALEIDASAI